MDKNHVIELDDVTYRLSGQTLETHKDFQSVRGCKFLVSDFDKSISRVMHVEADIKYAEAIVVRSLQDEGEFDEPVSIITHWKKKRGKKSTEIFFTAVPSRIYLNYLDKINGHNDLLILIPVFSILANFIEQLADKDPIAVVFRHDRFADLVIGKKNQFYFATRCMAFDTSVEQINSLWETISREIFTATQEQSVQIKRLICLNWIDAKEEIPTMEPSGCEHFMFNEEPITHEGTLHTISFTCALKLFPSMEGIAPRNGKLLYYSDKLSPFIMAFFVIAIIALLWGSFSFTSKTKNLEQGILAIENRIDLLKQDIPSQSKETHYLETLKFVDTLFHNRHQPSYKDIINDISMGISTPSIVEQLQIDYTDKTVQVKLNGSIRADFNTAYKAYQQLLSSLQKDGYAIDNSTFNTRIDSSRFELALSRSIQ
ncbi:MAG: hypothetical protein KKE44_04200 [Proteobacteria bacterium]|nr:hypothetical protein [Pseudomonadota bacterium]MBU1581932.1 hypothetical protein [Pseudomonadota bacterium]